ncbi:hypothetical protein TTHERM_00283110 (macronuclear) [Tetrahymena thermophila SB210]|uniref:Uncharacterized protein n=1 Tax=Tetrahymena thermophila (strain SB210) TaxID=312017 RepID=I7MK98_TETTS|nr:hypothetical protein TTHERM_00283110 [Tetrahymena thermophila SB210]EAR97922.2 hypothetical protein TTHERM_00283110 [Tetrahymena thermophila SB210]|eukprot:XP_001018167.2 hypothetical protein TTHERM_00283110 [Tetrahymena thermophila SB210]
MNGISTKILLKMSDKISQSCALLLKSNQLNVINLIFNNQIFSQKHLSKLNFKYHPMIFIVFDVFFNYMQDEIFIKNLSVFNLYQLRQNKNVKNDLNKASIIDSHKYLNGREGEKQEQEIH